MCHLPRSIELSACQSIRRTHYAESLSPRILLVIHCASTLPETLSNLCTITDHHSCMVIIGPCAPIVFEQSLGPLSPFGLSLRPVHSRQASVITDHRTITTPIIFGQMDLFAILDVHRATPSLPITVHYLVRA